MRTKSGSPAAYPDPLLTPGPAALKLLERLPAPQALSGNNHPGGQSQVLNIGRIRQIECYPAKSDEDNALDSISDTKNCFDWNDDPDNPKDSEDDRDADNESEIDQEYAVKETQTPEQWKVDAGRTVPQYIWSIRRSKKKVDKVLMTVTTMETRRNKWIMTNRTEWVNLFSPGSFISLSKNLI
jgi:hypothetical protein